MRFTAQEINEFRIASERRCPYAPKSERTHTIHLAGRSNVPRGSCEHCGTTAATIVREQPDVLDLQPERAT